MMAEFFLSSDLSAADLRTVAGGARGVEPGRDRIDPPVEARAARPLRAMRA